MPRVAGWRKAMTTPAHAPVDKRCGLAAGVGAVTARGTLASEHVARYKTERLALGLTVTVLAAIDISLNQRFAGDFRTIVQKYPGVFENREA